MIVTISGMRSQNDAIYANMAAPDMVGFYLDGPDGISGASASIVSGMLGVIPRIGIFQGTSPDVIAEFVDNGMIDIVRISDSRDEDLVSRVRESVNVPVQRSFLVRDRSDVEYALSALNDGLVFDIAVPWSDFDVSILEGVTVPYTVAGIGPGDVLGVVRALSPEGLEASTGLDTLGAKDPTKMTTFVYAARGNFEPIIEHH